MGGSQGSGARQAGRVVAGAKALGGAVARTTASSLAVVPAGGKRTTRGGSAGGAWGGGSAGAVTVSGMGRSSGTSGGRGGSGKREFYFLAFEIHDPVVRANVQDLQDGIADKRPELRGAFTIPENLHVTCGRFMLNDDERNDLSQRLDALVGKYMRNPGRIQLTFNGVGSFQNEEQFFVTIKADHHLRNFKKMILDFQKNLAEEEGYNVVSDYNEVTEAYHPHLTVVKMTKRFTKYLKYDTVPDEILQMNTQFAGYMGGQYFDNLCLLKGSYHMHRPYHEEKASTW